VITALAAAVPVVVAMVKVAVVLPAAIITEAGAVAAELLLDNVTVAPPVGAALLKVIVPVDEEPRTTLAGLTDTELSAADAVIVRVALLATPA
jgi:hypothetical protein